ncbi:dynein light chain Tctex-type 5 isoform X3 [Brachyhypopomus gauderio]|uniref:dynein light chain Tctex-type 5 isoform X3 n=1 Tax=Brachyhypopomus gauderio TaxID=698409 RepID=UPI00404199CC
MSDFAREKAAQLVKKRASLSSLGSHEVRAKESAYKAKDSTSTVSYIDEHGHHDDIPRPPVQMENTYQLDSAGHPEGRAGQLPPGREVVKARVKDLMIPRYKIIVVISIGQLADHSMQMSSRCLWDAANDTCASHTFKNSSLFAVANVYGVYFE